MHARWILIFALVVLAALALRRHESRLRDIALSAPDTRDAAAAFRSLADADSPTTRPSKPWLDDFAAFTRENSGDWFVGRCHDPYLSEAEAHAAALDDAMNAVYRLACQQIKGDPAALRRYVADHLNPADLLADKLTEHFDRPYGAVWTESVLLHASPQQINSYLSGYQNIQRAQGKRLAMLRMTAVGLAAAAWLMYIFLNAVTRGYFTTRLRLGAVAVTVVAVLLFI
jgi:hypothetical protein